MKHRKIAFFAFALGAATGGWAGNVTVSASAGSVAGIATTSGLGAWKGLTDSAHTAQIYYQTNPSLVELGSLSGAPHEFKCVDAQGIFAPHTFNGISVSGPGTTTSVIGSSTFSDPTPNAPQYYLASWTGSSSSSLEVSASGTYDPWIVTAGDLIDLGTAVGGKADLYFQSSLLGGFGASTGFNLAANQKGTYRYSVGVTQGGVQKEFLSVDVSRVGNASAAFSAKFTSFAGFDLYLLGSNAHDDGVTPGARVAAGTLVTSATQVQAIVASALRADGSLGRTLDFGLIDRNVALTTTDRTVPILQWNATTVQTVPEPAPVAAVALGVVALLRRRRKA